jgi:hypothetical protein
MACQHVHANGKRCRAPTKAEAEWCFYHDPARAHDRARESSAGGKARKRPEITLPTETPDLPLKSVGDVVVLLGETLNAVRKGKMEAKVGNAIGQLAGVLLRALEGSELAQRMEQLEARLAGMQPQHHYGNGVHSR